MLSSGNNALKTDEGNSSPTILFIIDPQVDFHTGSLKVPGAEEDSVRIAEMIKENMDSIDEIVISLDSHNRNHIAHAVFWKSDSEVPGDSVLEPQADRAPIYRPKAFTQITHKDVNEKWFPVDQSLKVTFSNLKIPRAKASFMQYIYYIYIGMVQRLHQEIGRQRKICAHHLAR